MRTFIFPYYRFRQPQSKRWLRVAVATTAICLALVGHTMAQSGGGRQTRLLPKTREAFPQSKQTRDRQLPQSRPSQQQSQQQSGSSSQLTLPDLKVSFLQAEATRIKFSVLNSGSSFSPSSRVLIQVRSNQDGRIFYETSRTVQSLQAGKFQFFDLPVSSGRLENGTVTVTADSLSRVVESNESNNSKRYVLHGSSNAPDLTVTELRNTGDILKITVKNVGQVSSSASRIKINIYTPGSGRPHQLTQRVRALNAGGSVRIHLHNLPVGLSGKRVTTYLDPDLTLAESDETNNHRELKIPDLATNGPDIQVNGFQIDRSKGEIYVHYKNVGRSALEGSVDLRLNIYEAGSNRPVERLIGEIRRLNWNQRGAARFFPKRMEPGMRIEAIADSSKSLSEANESNNRYVEILR